jgi:hypothetical protein
MSETKVNVLLFGLGGIGGIYASILSLSKAVNVHVVARSNYESVKEKGFKLVSQKFGDHDITFDGGKSLLRFRWVYQVMEIGVSSGGMDYDWKPLETILSLDGLVWIELMYSLEEL